MQKSNENDPHPQKSLRDAIEPGLSVPAEDAALPTDEPEKRSWHFLLEVVPLAVFFIAYRQFGIWSATQALMAVTALCVAVQWFLTRKIPLLTIITACVVGLFGLLTLTLHNEQFIKMKPTLVYSLFALILVIGRLRGGNPLAKVFGQIFPLTPRGWHLLTWRWVAFFLVLAVGNEILWRHVPEAVWVNCKVFGFLPATLLFGLCQTPLLLRESTKSD